MAKQLVAAVEVVGSGVLTSGNSFYLVSSQTEEGRSHVVTQGYTRLHCDCKSALYRPSRQCAHVAAVIAHKQRLQLDLAERADALTPAPRETRREVTTADRDTALMRRNNQPFSLMA